MVEGSVVEVARRFRDALEREGWHLTQILLYGSQVSGEVHADSDIDVAVILSEKPATQSDVGMALWRTAVRVDPRLSPVSFDAESFERDTWVPLIHDIHTTGIRVA